MLPRTIPYGRCPPVVASPPIHPTVAVFSHFPSSSSSLDATNDSDNNSIRSNSRGRTCLLPLFRLSRSGGGRLSPLNASVEREKEEEKEEEEEEEETGFEIDRQKAREALRKLDQQLQSLSQPESLPKKRPPPALPGAYYFTLADSLTVRRLQDISVDWLVLCNELGTNDVLFLPEI
ncbi:uncharacterized protein LOC109713349 isoform X2 [Ananas comosus]|uniref:Uncharacterized protein LOC109713349 isoform X2 n=1 Tax=Ananas comosus TaxID=4615 RepID=A0A6P5FHN3_ANACO|nr:uncharacterized protein LOC109713349 isoform X2 [Ananas comosus]